VQLVKKNYEKRVRNDSELERSNIRLRDLSDLGRDTLEKGRTERNTES